MENRNEVAFASASQSFDASDRPLQCGADRHRRARGIHRSGGTTPGDLASTRWQPNQQRRKVHHHFDMSVQNYLDAVEYLSWRCGGREKGSGAYSSILPAGDYSEKTELDATVRSSSRRLVKMDLIPLIHTSECASGRTKSQRSRRL